MYRKGSYIAARVAGVLAVMAMGLIVAIQTPMVQTWLSRKAADLIMKSMGGRLEYDELKIMPSGLLLLRNVALIDKDPYISEESGYAVADTLFSARTVTATVSISSLFRKEGIHLGRVSMEDASMHLTVEPGHYSSNISRMFKIERPSARPEPGPDIFDIRKVSLTNFRFRMNNLKESEKAYSGHGLDFGDIDLTMNLKAHGLKFTGSRMYGTADKLSLTEKSGYTIENLSGSCAAGQGETRIDNLHLIDAYSDVHLRYLSLTYPHHNSFSRFTEEVHIETDIARSVLSMRTIAAITGALYGNGSVLALRGGKVSGTVGDMSVSNLGFTEQASGISGIISCSATGLTDMPDMTVGAELSKFRFTTGELTAVLREWMPGKAPDLRKYAPGVEFELNAKASGPLNRLTAAVDIESRSGSAKADAELLNIAGEGKDTGIRARLRTSGLDIGFITGISMLGKCDLSAEAEAVFGRGEFPDIRLDNLIIGKIGISGYDYSDIRLRGALRDGTAEGRLTSSDSKLRLGMDLMADLAPKEDGSREFSIHGRADEIDLHALGIDKREGRSGLALGIAADTRLRDGIVDGTIVLQDISLENKEGVTEMGDVTLRAFPSGDEMKLTLESSFADMSLAGSGQLPDFIEDVLSVSVQRELPALFPGPEEERETGEYVFDATFHDSRELLAFVMPGLYIADSTSIRLSLADGGLLSGDIRSSRLAYGKNYMRDVGLTLDNSGHRLNADIAGSRLRAGNFEMERLTLTAFADDNAIGMTVEVGEISGTEGSARLNVDGTISRDDDGILSISLHQSGSEIVAGMGRWVFGESDITFRNGDIRISNMYAGNGPQTISIDGGYSIHESDTLRLEVKDIDLAILDGFLPKETRIGGSVSGDATLISGTGKLSGMLMNFDLDSLSIGGKNAGSITLASILEDEGEDINIYLRHDIDGHNAIYANGVMFTDDGRMDMSIKFDRLPLSLGEPFLTGILDKVDGSISGTVKLLGQPEYLSALSDDLYLNDVVIRPAVNGVEYTISGPMNLNSRGLYFNSLSIRDSDYGTGSLSGAIKYDHFKDFDVDLKTEFERLKMLDIIQQKESKGVYGLIRASGNASVTGPFQALNIVADASSSGDGNVHIPASGSGLSGSTSNLLTFTEPPKMSDPYEEMLSDYAAKTGPSGDVNIQARITATPGVKAYIEIDKSAGNIAYFSGGGSVSLHIRPSKAIFDLNGDYNINEGHYQFVIPGILNRNFEIQEGSSIKFGGDLMDSEVNISALYKLKTSLSTLIAGSSSEDTWRQVECGINISDRIRNPKLEFSINVPDLDPTTRSQVESALSTTDKVQKQFLSLLLLGSFLPDESSGIVNGSDLMLSNVTEFVSNQLNSILQKLDVPLDVGVGYHGTSGNTNIFDVAISTQLFNNRVIVESSVSNRNYATSSNANGDVVGDLDISIKLDRDGKFRLNMFSHSADEYTSYLDYSQRNGVGISFQKEFNNLRDFLRSLLPSGSRLHREAREASDGKEGQTVIKIEAQDE